MSNQDQDKPQLMPHAYDGIQEYDQRLPNWWLFTLYGTIAFSFLYWAYYFQFGIGQDDRVALNAELDALEARRMAAVRDIDDATLWKMSRNAKTVADGAAVYSSACAACHGPTLAGVKGLGFRLDDNLWVHGETPTAIYRNVNEGITFGGKPTGMVAQKMLGNEKVVAVVAYLLSKQTEGNLAKLERSQEPSQR